MTAKILLVAAALGTLVIPVVAHHSFASEYDVNKPIKFEKVVVTKVEWTNPHARFYVDVKDAKGTVVNWNLELASPNVLKRNGWSRNTLKEGAVISVQGTAAKDGSHLGHAQTVTLPDGKRILAGSATGDGQ